MKLQKLNYLNVGCGSKYHKDWVNVDMVAHSKDVIKANLLNGIPFPDNTFDVVYHSQVLEHFPKENALHFMRECYRVLKKGGIIRVVVPDLENIIDEYKKNLDNCLKADNDLFKANYDWIMLEMYDQTVRNYSGGQMAEFLIQPHLINEEYIFARIGKIGKIIRDNYIESYQNQFRQKKTFSFIGTIKKSIKYLIRKLSCILRTERCKVGNFRLGGEIHMWMYDRYSLSRILKDSGFHSISKKDPFTSDIPDWNDYELDVKEGFVNDPASLFMEAIK